MYKFLQRTLKIESEKQVQRFVLNVFLFGLIIFVYSIARICKDSISLGDAKGSGILSYLKTFATLPSAILIAAIYAELRKRFSRLTIFNIIATVFMLFFLVYAFYLGPNAPKLHISPQQAAKTVSRLSVMFGNSFIGKFIGAFCANFYKNILCYWTTSLLYIMAELWGTVAIGLLFWSFANQTTLRQSATTTFTAYALTSNIATTLAGTISKISTSNWNTTFQILSLVMAGAFVLSMVLYYRSHVNALSDKDLIKQLEAGEGQKTKVKAGGILKSLKLIWKSPALFYIAITIICYGTCMALIESNVKNGLGKYGSFDKVTVKNISSNIMIFQGAFATLVTLLFFNRIRNARWITLARVTPLVLLAVGVPYFALQVFPGIGIGIANALNLPTYFPLLVPTAIQGGLFISIIIGFIHTVLAKSSKYLFFDITKERAYVPLTDEEKTLGKASVDLIGGRLGKALGSFLIASVLLPLMGGAEALVSSAKGIDNIVRAVALIYTAGGLIFYFAVMRLSKVYDINEAKLDKMHDTSTGQDGSITGKSVK